MPKPVVPGLLLALLLAAPAVGEDAEERPPLHYDAVDAPFEQVVARATRAKRPIFIEFFADG